MNTIKKINLDNITFYGDYNSYFQQEQIEESFKNVDGTEWIYMDKDLNKDDLFNIGHSTKMKDLVDFAILKNCFDSKEEFKEYFEAFDSKDQIIDFINSELDFWHTHYSFSEKIEFWEKFNYEKLNILFFTLEKITANGCYQGDYIELYTKKDFYDSEYLSYLFFKSDVYIELLIDDSIEIYAECLDNVNKTYYNKEDYFKAIAAFLTKYENIENMDEVFDYIYKAMPEDLSF